MLGDQVQSFFTVKDLSSAEFIQAFAQYLKKNNHIDRPNWADYVKTSSSIILPNGRKRTGPPRRRLDLLQSRLASQENLYSPQSRRQTPLPHLWGQEQRQ